MRLDILFPLFISLLIIEKCIGISSPLRPFTTYNHAVELAPNVADLWWTVDDAETEIVFELHIKTIGWIALGISPAGGMKGADIGVGWVDQAGNVHFQDRYAVGTSKPILDNTTIDWFALNGREENGWTGIQFKRLLDTCDSMDVQIKSGTNNLIFAYGIADPDLCHPNGDITYHETRRGSRILPLRSYGNPPTEDKFAKLDYFEFRFDNYLVPPNDTVYYCKVFKAPSNYPIKRHAIAHKIIIEPSNRDLIHHLLLHECNPSVKFDDNNLPDGICDNMATELAACMMNIATLWAVGGDEIVEFPEVAGYPVGADSDIKYYMLQMHYDNPKLASDRHDNTGLRFYLGNELREHDLGYFTFGVASGPVAIAIPPRVNEFMIDSYCSAAATKNFPESGITVISSFPHTHLQGRSVWTKLIRNKTAVQYLFNAEAFDFNYQYENLLPKPIKLYRGDEFATRCVYNTMNKNEITLGGESTREEMCLQIVTYYPRMRDNYMCLNLIAHEEWEARMNESISFMDYTKLKKWLLSLDWTSESAAEWQEFFNKAARYSVFGPDAREVEFLSSLPKYEDLKPVQCIKQQPAINDSISILPACNSVAHEKTFILFSLFPFFINKFLLQ